MSHPIEGWAYLSSLCMEACLSGSFASVADLPWWFSCLSVSLALVAHLPWWLVCLGDLLAFGSLVPDTAQQK